MINEKCLNEWPLQFRTEFVITIIIVLIIIIAIIAIIKIK